jgi:hypothetical protein
LDTIASGQTFTITLATQGIQLGTFTNAQKTYFANPQKLNAQGQIIGHTHIVVEAIDSLTTTKVTNPKNFVFFKGINGGQDAQGNVAADVTGGLAPGAYRMCTIVSSQTHQPAIVPIAQHGSLDDCVYVSFFSLFLYGVCAHRCSSRRTLVALLPLEMPPPLEPLQQPEQQQQPGQLPPLEQLQQPGQQQQQGQPLLPLPVTPPLLLLQALGQRREIREPPLLLQAPRQRREPRETRALHLRPPVPVLLLQRRPPVPHQSGVIREARALQLRPLVPVLLLQPPPPPPPRRLRLPVKPPRARISGL